MHIESLQFGKIEFESDRVLDFPEGLLGFSRLRRFLHVSPDDYEPVEFLMSIDEPNLAFPLINPYLTHADYDFALSDDDHKSLALGDGGKLLAYAVVTFGSSLEESSLNLLAPVLINPSARRGRQVVLEDSGYKVAEPLRPRGQ